MKTQTSFWSQPYERPRAHLAQIGTAIKAEKVYTREGEGMDLVRISVDDRCFR